MHVLFAVGDRNSPGNEYTFRQTMEQTYIKIRYVEGTVHVCVRHCRDGGADRAI